MDENIYQVLEINTSHFQNDLVIRTGRIYQAQRYDLIKKVYCAFNHMLLSEPMPNKVH